MCQWTRRFRKRRISTHRAIAHFWIALRHWRDPDPTAMLTHLVAAAQPARMMSIPDELFLARIILRRMGIDPLMLRSDEMPVIPLSDLDPVRAQATCTPFSEAPGSKSTLPAAGTSSASQHRAGSVRSERCQPGIHSDRPATILGGFATIAVAAGISRQRLEAGLKGVARRYNAAFRRASSTAVEDLVAICSIRRGTFSISLPWTVSKTERVVRDLSRDLSGPVLWLHVHDGDLWMYKLYCSGRIMDRFNPLPDYWPGTRTKRMVAMWAGNADRFAQWWPGTAPAVIEKYLRRWDETEVAGQKAYPDDVFQYGDCSQAQDFLRRLGAIWPDCASPSISCRTFACDM